MARASQSKQPAFDRSELSDLIHSPAVGNGVSSHILSHTSTVDMLPTVPFSPTVANLPTVVETSTPFTHSKLPKQIAVIPEPNTVVPLSTVSNSPTVDTSIWLTEGGDLVPRKRVRAISRAQDVINPAEENVYNVLWAVKPGQAETKTVQAGYDYIGKRTRLAKKTIQRIIAKLIEKDFIAIEKPADIYERTSTTYRVFSYKQVLDRHKERGRTHVAKMGPGFSYVKQPSNMSTVVINGVSTVAISITPTVVNSDLSTVVRGAISFKDRKSLDNSTSTDLQELRDGLVKQIGWIDEDAARRLFEGCQNRAGKSVSPSQILSVVSTKLPVARKARNPIGFLIDAVPKAFPLSELEPIKEQWTPLNSEDEHAYWEGVLANENAPEALKREAKHLLGL